jgi:hypothetical protein
MVKRYEKTLKYTKKQHWRDWLERAEEPDIWTVHKVISALAMDGGKARIPTLKHKVGEQEAKANTNVEKSIALAKSFFLPKLQVSSNLQYSKYPKQCMPMASCRITHEQVQRQMHKIKPYKAPGPDRIPNIILTKNAHILTDRLLLIYEAMFEDNLMYKLWKSFTMVVLHKPGKPRYNMPKACRPITLLNTMWKVLTAMVAELLTHVTEKYQLLLANHFGGRLGCSTTNAMHLLMHSIKTTWRAGKVTVVLFLDIEGVFPNAVPS